MSLTIKEILTMAETQLREADVPDCEHDARALLEFSTAMTKAEIFMNWTKQLDEFHCEKYLDMVERRGKGEPLQYITGSQSFMGIDITVNENVLIPRQDTEVLVENAKYIAESKLTKKQIKPESPYLYEKIPGRKNRVVLDLCCGSGAIGIAMAKLCPNVKKVICTDISPEAVAVARENANRAGVSKKTDFHVGNLFDALKKRDKFDMILSNPPYIQSNVIPTLQTEVKDHEPMLALDGGEDGLVFYREIISRAPERLEKQGVLMMEIGHDQAAAVKELLEESGNFSDIEIIKDYAGHDRVAAAVLKGK